MRKTEKITQKWEKTEQKEHNEVKGGKKRDGEEGVQSQIEGIGV